MKFRVMSSVGRFLLELNFIAVMLPSSLVVAFTTRIIVQFYHVCPYETILSMKLNVVKFDIGIFSNLCKEI
jgi:hypothetical protein